MIDVRKQPAKTAQEGMAKIPLYSSGSTIPYQCGGGTHPFEDCGGTTTIPYYILYNASGWTRERRIHHNCHTAVIQ
jgi:hypothetical protein